ncbi:universal stress protein [Streptomyces sp. NBC_01591]|uniref:universal stress protein n=1 Tax=Streptomyces sp. NBC_01591 TaxID=2975888 RepID=UPI003FA35137
MEPAIIVGLDGSPEGLAAARWAADQAVRCKLTLRLMHAWPPLVLGATGIPAEMDQNYWARRIVHTTRAPHRRQPGRRRCRACASASGTGVHDDRARFAGG